MSAIRQAVSHGLLWILFFLISAGLGYPSLNRYNPRNQLPDAAVYARLATADSAAIHDHFRLRILVPLLAHGVYRMTQGRTGTWDPLMFSFLVVNSWFVATTAYLLCAVGITLLSTRSVALLGAALYLLNFAIANLQLAALIDSAEACLLMAVVASMFYRRWFLLPVLGAIGALAKESFVPFSIAMATAWLLAESDEKFRLRRAVWIATMAVVEVITLTELQSSISGHAVWPWAFMTGMSSPTNYGTNLLHSFIDRNSWYILIWLLPLGLAGIKLFPRPWKFAAAAGALTALALNAYHSTVSGGGGGIGRYVFNIAGPLLSLSAAAFLSQHDLRRPAALD
ncbi:MAG TPA: hypothetical protein VJO35_18160 [Terriglobales bacterium]|nr:hypothetical protein [Terriglobales bacterium]